MTCGASCSRGTKRGSCALCSWTRRANSPYTGSGVAVSGADTMRRIASVTSRMSRLASLACWSSCLATSTASPRGTPIRSKSRVFMVVGKRKRGAPPRGRSPSPRANEVSAPPRPKAEPPRERSERALGRGRFDEPAHPRVHRERRRLVLHQVLELLPELLQRQARRRRELRQLVRVVEVVAPEAKHVA